MKIYEWLGNPDDADCLIGHSYGTSIDEDSVNYQLAEIMLTRADGRPLIADRTLVNAFPGGDSQVTHIV